MNDCSRIASPILPNVGKERGRELDAMRLAALLLLVAAGASQAATHCTATEKVAFSCPLGASRVVSLCMAPSTGPGTPELSYRFGRLGAPELVFPSPPKGSLQRFRYAHYFRYRVDRTEVTFSNAGAEYTVFDYYEGEDKPSYARGVRVGVDGKNRELTCKGAVVSRLVQLGPLLPCDAENALSSCR